MNTIIYHSKDLDGVASGCLLTRKFRSNVKLKKLGYQYGEDFDIRKLSRQEVIMADVSFDMEKMFSTAKMTKEFTWVDHHLSAYNDFMKYCSDNDYQVVCTNIGLIQMFRLSEFNFTYYYSDVLSACEICDKLYNQHEGYSEAISLLGQYDTWRNNIKRMLITDSNWDKVVIPFQYGMRLYGKELCDVYEVLENIVDWRSDFDIKNISEKGRTIIGYQEGQNKSNMKHSFDIELGGLKGIAYNGGPFNSQTFKSVWDEYRYDFMMPFSFDSRGWNCSLYTTKDEVDILSIAKSFGGGGHKNACGFQLKPDELGFNKSGSIRMIKPKKKDDK